MIPQDENDGLYFTWDPVRPAYLLYIKIFATKEYSSFSSMKQRSWLGDEVNLRGLIYSIIIDKYNLLLIIM